MFLLVLLILQHSQGFNTDDCQALGTPRSKCIVEAMDGVLEKHIEDLEQWVEEMSPYWTENMIYDSNWTPNGDFGNSSSLEEWYYSEHIPYIHAFENVSYATIIWIGNDNSASLIAYGKSRWRGDLGTIPGQDHAGVEVTIWDLDFYRIDDAEDAISYNWCLIDFVDLMRQLGYQVLPKPALNEGLMFPPAAMDGIPAPVSRLVSSVDTQISLDLVSALLYDDFVLGDVPSPIWAEDMVWYGGAGFGMATSKDEYEEHMLGPLRAGLSQRELQLDMLLCEGVYCGAHGYLAAMHTGQWLGEQPTGLPIRLRFALHWRVDPAHTMVRECWAMFDLPAAFNMIGVNLFARMDENHYIGHQ